MAFSPDGGTLVSGSSDGVIKFWPAPFDQSGKTLGKADEAVKDERRRISSGKPSDQPSAPGLQKLSFLAMSPDGKTLAVISDSPSFAVKLLSFPGGGETAMIKQSRESGNMRISGQFSGLAFSPDGRMLASCAHSFKSVALWSLPAGEQIRQWQDAAQFLAFSSDGAMLAVGDTRYVRFWNTSSGEQRNELYTGDSGPLAFSPDGKWLVAPGPFLTVLLLRQPFDKPALKLAHHTASVRALAFSADSKLLAIAFSSGVINIWAMPDEAKDAAFLTALFDPDSMEAGVSVRQYTLTGKTKLIASSREPLPAGAVCTCNVVSGRRSSPASGPGRVCVCIPVK